MNFGRIPSDGIEFSPFAILGWTLLRYEDQGQHFRILKRYTKPNASFFLSLLHIPLSAQYFLYPSSLVTIVIKSITHRQNVYLPPSPYSLL